MTIILETERLILRPLRRSDLATLAVLLNNFNVSKTTAGIPFPYAVQDAEDFFAIAQRDEPRTLRLSITGRGADDVIFGGIEYEQDGSENRAELGYWLAEPQWGKGYGREAARAITDHALTAAKYPELVASHHLGNDASRRILEGLGFRNVDVKSEFSRANGTEMPVMHMRLTRAGWKKRAR